MLAESGSCCPRDSRRGSSCPPVVCPHGTLAPWPLIPVSALPLPLSIRIASQLAASLAASHTHVFPKGCACWAESEPECRGHPAPDPSPPLPCHRPGREVRPRLGPYPRPPQSLPSACPGHWAPSGPVSAPLEPLSHRASSGLRDVVTVSEPPFALRSREPRLNPHC